MGDSFCPEVLEEGISHEGAEQLRGLEDNLDAERAALGQEEL